MPNKKKEKAYKYNDREKLIKACENCDIEIIKTFVDKEITNYDECFKIACKHNYDQIARLMIENNLVKLEMALSYACEHGNKQLVNLILEKQPDHLESGLDRACNSGEIELVKLLLNNGAKKMYALHVLGKAHPNYLEIENYVKMLINTGRDYKTYNEGLNFGCYVDDIEFVKLMIDNGADDWNGGLYNACCAYSVDLVFFMIEKGATEWVMEFGISKYHNVIQLIVEKGGNDWYYRLEQACRKGNIDIKAITNKPSTFLGTKLQNACFEEDLIMVQRILSQDNFYDITNSSIIFSSACSQGNMDIINLLIKKGANQWDKGLLGACCGGHINIVQFMIQMGASNWNDGLYAACLHIRINIVKLMIEKGANDWNGAMSNMRNVFHDCMFDHMEIIKLLIENGADEIHKYINLDKMQDKKKMMTLIELGMCKDKLKKINGIDELYNIIDKRKKVITQALDDIIVNDIVSVINTYVSLG